MRFHRISPQNCCIILKLFILDCKPLLTFFIQNLGDRINLLAHLHFLMTEGGADNAGVIHPDHRGKIAAAASAADNEILAFYFSRKNLTALL
jgi:hypothetical protein